ncbi:nicotinate-nucleotide adenylyltransferase [Bacillus sp. Marseille-P3661]|uniref:nicotinate-nucleotide adenylyltransferase n=1 Tax=Bacillus sp. Marseille-P3661 TaxID=1936234 RepID=UPI000C86440B
MKVGLLGGTFDPPHYGHLMIAQEVLTNLKLDQIWFIPTNVPPHKDGTNTDGLDRIEMVNRAIAGNPNFLINTIEFDRVGPSYTYDTITLLNEIYPQHQFYFIIGADMVEYLPKWHRIEELVDKISFVGVKRPNYKVETKYNLLEVEIPLLDISSSDLRFRFENNLNTRYFLPEDVRQYIEEKSLYGAR